MTAAIWVDVSGLTGSRPSPLPAESPGATPTSDTIELARLAAGDVSSMAALYDRHSSAVFGLAVRITKDRGLAEDVVQETFVGVWKHCGRFDPARASARTWIMSIAHHRAIDAVRRRRVAVASLDTDDGVAEMAPASPDVWPAVAARLDRTAVTRALRELPEAQRQSVELAYFAGLTQAEIAARMGAPLGTVKSRVRLGLLRLRELLDSTVEHGPDNAIAS